MPITPQTTRRIPPRRRGAVMVITLLAMLLLAGLMFYVINLGSTVDKRIAAQNHADAQAVAAAGFTARSLNTVAMNNVSMARLIAFDATLDSLPLATLFSYKEEMDNYTQTNSQGLSQSLQDQLGRGVSDWWVSAKLQEMLNNIGQSSASQKPQLKQELSTLIWLLDGYNDKSGDTTDQQILDAINWNDPNALNTPTGDNTYMTFYDFAGSPPGVSTPHPADRGLIWKAMQALDQMNQTTMQNLPTLTYLNARQAAQTNLDAEKNYTGMSVPDIGVVPWKHGTFDDFQRPVLNGLLPLAIDNKITNRGPYDAIFGWRNSGGGFFHTSGHSVDTSVVPGGGRGSVPIGRGGDADWVPTGPPTWVNITSYSTYGPYEWMMRQIHAFKRASLPYSRFDYWTRTISSIKLSYLWPGKGPQSIIDPKWVDTFPEAAAIAQNNPSQVVETAFVVVEMKSRYPLDQQPPTNSPTPKGQAPTWAYVTRGRPSVPWVSRMPGWVDPRTWAAPMIDNYIWRDQWIEMVNFDLDIGITPVLDANGKMIPQKVYRTDEYTFAGINIGKPVFVRNPFNVTDRSALPAPTDIDHAQLPPTNTQARWADLNVLTVARFQDNPVYWPARFTGQKPYPYATAVAQAKVFNDHSWDLWTQMWHSELTPVTNFNDWATRFASPAFPDRYDAPSDQDDTVRYLQSVQGMAPALLNH